MLTKQSEAHLRLLATLPVTAHRRGEVPLNPYTGKPLNSPLGRGGHKRGRDLILGPRVNVWLPPVPTEKK